MVSMVRWILALTLPALTGPAMVGLVLAGEPAKTEDEVLPALDDYVSRPDDSFAWRVRDRLERPQGRVYRIELTSQQWKGNLWKHSLHLHEPKTVTCSNHVLLFITGGSTGREPGEDSYQLGLQLAQSTGVRVAILHQVPNQPLLGNRKEDDLISETWLHYLRTGDAEWPLLFPMVKSAVRAMDALQALARQEWKVELSGFVVTGASKRGWTSWLTAAADRRVVAVAPIVIDVLNFKPQMQRQLDSWGAFSEQIADYAHKGLLKTKDESEREALLRRMMDPYSYRQRLTLPKLIISGTNDRYWVVDATQLYWDGLVGPKYVLKLPNAGHGLDGGRFLALSTLAVFFRQAVVHTPLPQLRWSQADSGADIQLAIEASVAPKAGRLWLAHSDSKDFRPSTWRSQPLEFDGGKYVGKVARPERGYVAWFGELQYELGGLPYSLTTLVWRN